ncbi:MAG: hypothetical protein GY749_15265 [Desulfobacteraceae bacterium]|nr:hypothetical protein [Desulfobacteraceae bacterium]
MLEIWMSIVGCTMAVSGLPQIRRIWQRKQSDDVSLSLWFIILHGQIWWVYYGIVNNLLSVWLSNSVGIAVNSLTIFLVLKYRNRQQSTETIPVSESGTVNSLTKA